MARYEASGLSGEGFCKAEGIGKSAFWRWRRRLAKRGRRGWQGGVRGTRGPCAVVVGRRAGPRWRRGAAGAPSAVLIPAAERRIWLCVAAADMRRSFDGLAALARNHLGEDPADGWWFVFVNLRWTVAPDREAGLSVYLSDADVPIDTNHLVRAQRPIPAGATGCARGRRSAPSASAWSRACSRPARCSAAGRGCVHVPGQRAPARRRASRLARRLSDAAGVEDAVRRRPPALRSRARTGPARLLADQRTEQTAPATTP